MNVQRHKTAAVFGASGGIGRALVACLRERGCERIYALSRGDGMAADERIVPLAFDLTREDTIAAAAHAMADPPPELVIVATGVLTLADGTGPEKSLRQLDRAAMERVFLVNTIGPALVAKHTLPLLPRDRAAAFAVLGARVGSIADNGLGGWHSYRASKAALAMLVRNFAIEMRRTHEHAVIAAIHPGTVDTALSQPFQANLPAGQLTSPEDAARHILAVLEGLGPQHSGGHFDWRGTRIAG